MRLLIDTHILLWCLDDNLKLSNKARQLISNPENDVYVSHISLWEIQIKIMKGKLEADLTEISEALPKNEFQELAIHKKHILALSNLQFYHNDPFDRMLIAQALTEPLILLTHDKDVSRYSDAIILV